MIRNAPKLQITPPTTSPRPGRKRGESFIRNVSQKYKTGTNAEPLKQKKKIERTQPVSINTQRHQHHSINKNRDSPSIGLYIPPLQHHPGLYPQNPLLQSPIHDADAPIKILTISASSEPATSILIKPTNYSINAINTSCETGSRKSKSKNCENSREYQPPKIKVPPHVIEPNPIINSDTKFFQPHRRIRSKK